MLAVKTARYHSVQSMNFSGLIKNNSDTYVNDNNTVMRFAPAASASRGVSYKLVHGAKTKDTATAFFENRFGHIVYSGDRETYMVDRNHADPGTAEEAKMETQTRRELLDLISPPTARKDRAALLQDANNKVGPWNISRVTVAGQPLIRFERQRDNVAPGKWREKIYETVWTDPQTNLVVRSEQRDIDLNANKEESSIIYDQFRYDEEIPETAFQVPMPPQANLRVYNFSKDKKSLEVSDADRAAIQKLIAVSDLAWSQGDFAQFAALWDFDYLGNTYATPAEAAQFATMRSQHYEKLGYGAARRLEIVAHWNQ